MKPQHTFTAARAAAQHCPELLRRGPEPAELIPQLTRLGERLAKALPMALAALCGGDAPTVTALPPRETSESELAEQIGPLAANALLSSGVPGVTLLASIEGKALLRLVDRAFGGTGEPPVRLPDAFPLSAELMIQRIETLVARCLAAALGHADETELQVLRRDSRFAELAPFPAGIRLIALPVEVMEGMRAPWTLTLALPLAMLPKLLGQGDGSGAARTLRPANPAREPFSELPLPLSARLVDMAVPLHAVSALEVGAVLPVAVARAVPLRIGERIVAHGTVGAQDDRIALKLTQIA